MPESRQTFTFQAEARQLLDLMIHSVYSNPDIFLRELVSNASDALDKLRFEALTNESLSGLTGDLHIQIATVPADRTLAISDNGIGMNRDELVEFIGTIARSGTKEYVKLLREKGSGSLPEELIGQFGIGFYSSFMVAGRVTIVTRRAGEEKAWKWESPGDGTYTLEEDARQEQGTTVTLFLKPKEEEGSFRDYSDPEIIREIIRRYSDFVAWPIRMKDENGAEAALNSMKALWTRPESEITEEEHKEFYRHITHDWNKPARMIFFKAEGGMEFRALLYVPSKAPLDMFIRDMARGIQLYIRRIFIMDDCRDIVPEYLRFLRGLVDSEDLPLNISREMLQQSRQVETIRKSVTRKVLDSLASMLKDTREAYVSFWQEFGKVLKEGLFSDARNRERILEVALFETTGPDGLATLDEYVGRMPGEQDEIYYVTAPTLTVGKNSPHLEAFASKGREVLILADPVDEIWTPAVTEYKGKKFTSVARGLVDLDESGKSGAENEKPSDEGLDALLKYLGKTLEDEVKEVRISGRLKASPSCLVGEDFDLSPQMEALLRAAGQDVLKVRRNLEINPSHPLVGKLRKIYEEEPSDPRVARFARILFGLAALSEGGRIDDPTAFSREVADLLAE
ncbi:MAG: molecular chaperone HtpG [Thermovirgaceae bacterium]|nr:molecular chaperone HtpG [Thermovirgaceae bacterium]